MKIELKKKEVRILLDTLLLDMDELLDYDTDDLEKLYNKILKQTKTE